MKKINGFLWLFPALLFFAIPVLAHHSFSSEFDYKQLITVTGVLTRVEWINPHVYFYVEVKDGKDHVDTWSLECFSPGQLRRGGLSRADIVARVGQPMTVHVYHAKDETKTLGFASEFDFSDGTKVQFSMPLREEDSK